MTIVVRTTATLHRINERFDDGEFIHDAAWSYTSSMLRIWISRIFGVPSLRGLLRRGVPERITLVCSVAVYR